MSMTSEIEAPEEVFQTSQATPIFLLCSPCSGSNLLCGLLAGHPQIYATPGLGLLAHPTVAEFFKHCQETSTHAHGLLRTVAQLYTGEQTVATIETARRWLGHRREWSSTKVLETLCEKVAPARLLDRCLAYADDPAILEAIQDTFPKAAFVHLVRHPVGQGLAVMHSLEGIAGLYDARSIDYSDKRPEVDPQHAWFNTQATIMEFAETLPAERYLTFRIEDLLADPENALARLFSWLGLDFSPEDYAAMRQKATWTYAGPGPFNAAGGNEYDPLQITDGKLPEILPVTLDEALPWRSKKAGLADPVKMLANALGY